MTDAYTTGERVLAGLTYGREIAIAQRKARGAVSEQLVRRHLDRDLIAGHKPRGRAGRIARRLRRDGWYLSVRGVAKVLERLTSGSDSLLSNGQQSTTSRNTDEA